MKMPVAGIGLVFSRLGAELYWADALVVPIRRTAMPASGVGTRSSLFMGSLIGFGGSPGDFRTPGKYGTQFWCRLGRSEKGRGARGEGRGTTAAVRRGDTLTSSGVGSFACTALFRLVAAWRAALGLFRFSRLGYTPEKTVIAASAVSFYGSTGLRI